MWTGTSVGLHHFIVKVKVSYFSCYLFGLIITNVWGHLVFCTQQSFSN